MKNEENKTYKNNRYGNKQQQRLCRGISCEVGILGNLQWCSELVDIGSPGAICAALKESVYTVELAWSAAHSRSKRLARERGKERERERETLSFAVSDRFLSHTKPSNHVRTLLCLKVDLRRQIPPRFCKARMQRARPPRFARREEHKQAS